MGQILSNKINNSCEERNSERSQSESNTERRSDSKAETYRFSAENGFGLLDEKGRVVPYVAGSSKRVIVPREEKGRAPKPDGVGDQSISTEMGQNLSNVINNSCEEGSQSEPNTERRSDPSAETYRFSAVENDFGLVDEKKGVPYVEGSSKRVVVSREEDGRAPKPGVGGQSISTEMGQILFNVINTSCEGSQSEPNTERRSDPSAETYRFSAVENDFGLVDEKKGVPYVAGSSKRVVVSREDNGRAPKPERWIKHYSSSHKILLVGEGDFSFSACLARSLGSADNMVATSLDSIGFVLKNYKSAMSNIVELKDLGCTVKHGVDATEMADHSLLKDLLFDRIVYNFPLAGFFKDESRESQLRRNQELVSLFFRNARKMISKNGEIHVTHKSSGFFLEWNLALLASINGLRLKEEVHFDLGDYPGYNNKYGYGGNKNFDYNPSKTYKFELIREGNQLFIL